MKKVKSAWISLMDENGKFNVQVTRQIDSSEKIPTNVKFSVEDTMPCELIKWVNDHKYRMSLVDYLSYCDAFTRNKCVNAPPSREYYEFLLDVICNGLLDYFPAPGDFPTTDELDLAFRTTYEE